MPISLMDIYIGHLANLKLKGEKRKGRNNMFVYKQKMRLSKALQIVERYIDMWWTLKTESTLAPANYPDDITDALICLRYFIRENDQEVEW